MLGAFALIGGAIGFVLGRVVGWWALAVPLAFVLWLGEAGELEGDLNWVVGGFLGGAAAIGVAVGTVLRTSARRRARAWAGEALPTR